MQGFELATLFVAPSDFQSFCETDHRKLVGVFWPLIEVVTGHCKNAVNRAGGHLGAPLLIFQTFSWGRRGHQRSHQEGEKAPCSFLRSRAPPQNRTTAFLQWIMSPRALPHCKYAVNLAVARGTVNMQSFGLASIYVAPSVDLEASKNCFPKSF